MKRYFFIPVLLLFVLAGNAQVKQEVIASAGRYDVSGNISVSWTLGETIIPTYTNGDLVLTHGFQQQLLVTSVEENLDIPVKVKVFPNPASEVVNIQFETALDQEIIIIVLDSQGKIIKRDLIETTTTEKQINLQEMAPGIYYIRLTKGRLVNVYKVVKL